MLFAILIFTIVPHAFAEYEDTIVVMETDLGRFIIEFFPDSAPNHVKNFVELSNTGFYTDTKFHRIIEGFMIQGGDPLTAKVGHSPSEWGTGDPGYSIDAEFNNIQHSRGILSMARSADPNSAGSQFFIVHKDSNFLDGQYTVFGRIITEESFVTLDKLATLETAPNDQPMKPSVTTIKVVQVLDRSELSDLPKYVPPKITSIEEMVAPPTNQKQVFKEYGFGFISPAGWLVQTPPVTSSTSPQVAVVGPKTSTSMPAISIRADPSLSKTLDENVDALRQNILPLIESGALKIAGEESLEINGYDAHMIKAVGHFEDSSGVEQRIGFASIMIKNGNVVYTIQYTNTIESFDAQEQYYIDMINSLELFVPQPMGVNSEGNMDGISSTLKDESQSEGGGCLIATAAFGSEMAPQVQFLREIRDNTVMSTQSGTAFMTGFNQFYYSFSPAVADYERENPVFKEAVKVTLTPLLTSLTLLNYVDVDSEQEMLGYGIGIILLNIGMYFVAPAAAIVVIKNRIKHV
jgi:peptidyl-prolyl cis-trans isomerase B (cyclophilin B)